MNHEYSEIIEKLRCEVKNRANEVSHRLMDEDIIEVRELLKVIDDLEDRMTNFDEFIDYAWEERAIF